MGSFNLRPHWSCSALLRSWPTLPTPCLRTPCSFTRRSRKDFSPWWGTLRQC